MAELDFSSDYLEGAHPAIMNALMRTNLEKTAGYGFDAYSESARDRIRAACACPDAGIWFLVGGTQANATVLDALLAPYQGVIAASSGHINVHEAGAIEWGGHKVISLPQHQGKLDPCDVEACFCRWESDPSRDHIVMPGAVYISQPTEYGTLYSLDELGRIAGSCHAHGARLYADGARLAYALASDEGDVGLPDLASYCDAFTIGGTKCGALFGEAVVLPNPAIVSHFFSIIKQHGALLAKSRIAGIQFDELFKGGLYGEVGHHAVELAMELRAALVAKGYDMPYDSPTNQQFVVLENDRMEELASKVGFSVFEAIDDSHSLARFATSWASSEEDVKALISLL